MGAFAAKMKEASEREAAVIFEDKVLKMSVWHCFLHRYYSDLFAAIGFRQSSTSGSWTPSQNRPPGSQVDYHMDELSQSCRWLALFSGMPFTLLGIRRLMLVC